MQRDLTNFVQCMLAYHIKVIQGLYKYTQELADTKMTQILLKVLGTTTLGSTLRVAPEQYSHLKG